MLALILGIYCSIMILTHLLLLGGIIANRLHEKKLHRHKTNYTPHVSVVIPARNEEANLPSLFESLNRLDYKSLEIIFVNDRSTDNTIPLMEEFAKQAKYPVRIVSLETNPANGNPKQYALHNGVEASSGEILLFTDADCTVSPKWAEYMTAPFRDPSVSVSFGPVYTRLTSGYLSRFQMFDHLFRFFYNSGSAGIGNVTGVYGNNMAVRRKTLAEIGGYKSLKYSVTEDNALVSRIRKLKKGRIISITFPQALVKAEPQHSWRDLYSQQLRWSTGAFFSPDILTRFGYFLVKFYLASGFIALFIVPFFNISGIITLSTFISMASIAVIGGIMLKMPFISYWLFFFPNLLWSMLFYLYIDLTSFLKKPVHWKGNKLEVM